MDRVFLDTGDLLVTARRVAFKSVSVPLADITAARTVPTQKSTARVGRGRPCPVRGRHVVGALFAGWAVGVYFLYRPVLTTRSPTVTVMLAVLPMLAVVIVGVAASAAARPTLRAMVVWHAVTLTVRGREVELYRTRDPEQAAETVAAINQAVTDSRR